MSRAHACRNTKALTTLLLAAALGAATSAPSDAIAGTPAPAWTITSYAAPTVFTAGDLSGKDVYAITATNTGGAPTLPGPITITDTLPAPLAYHPEGLLFGEDQSANSQAGESNTVNCEPGPPITCTDLQDLRPLQPGESILMHVAVDTSEGAPADVTNHVTISGGGAAAASASETTAIGSAAAFGFHRFDGGFTNADGSATTHAGSHPYQASIGFALNNIVAPSETAPPSGNPKDIVTNLPAGLIVNPAVTAKCTESQLEQAPVACPDASAVGTVFVTVGLNPFASGQTAALYNMQPAPGAPAELAFDAAGLGIFVHLRGGVRTGSDYGLTASAHEILQFGNVLGATATLWGNPSDPSHDPQRGRCVLAGGTCPVERTSQAFLTMPSACSGPLTTTISSDSWQNPGDYLTASFASHDGEGNPVGVNGCAGLAFNPSITVQPETTTADSPTGLNVVLRLPQDGLTNPNADAEANLKDVVVALPAGLAVSPSAANGLGACSPEQIALNTPQPPSCPDDSKLGDVEIVTPLLQKPLEGAVYLAQQQNNPFRSLLALYLVAEASGAVIKLAGHVEADPTTGRLTASFDQNPQLPFTELKLHIFNGPRAPLITPPACGTYQTQALLSPWSGTAPVPSSSGFAIVGNCGSPFGPAFAAGTVDPRAGAFTPFALTLSRQDGEQRFGAVQARTPAGLLGVLRAVPRCPEPQASQGSCGAESLIGHTTVAAGPGPSPFYVGGNVFLTGPYKGAPFGLSIVVHAIAGPFDLGLVVVRAAISVDTHTAQITATSDTLPTILDGIPLDLRVVNVTLDRPGFIFNPTSCAPSSVSAEILSTTGSVERATDNFKAADCATLPFKPRLAASTAASASRALGASLDVTVSSNGGPEVKTEEANISAVKVDLPAQLPARLSTLNKACLASVFEADPARCPAESDVGAATAKTPALAQPLTGPAYLVSHGGAAFPDLEIVLQGEGIVLILDGKTDIKHGVTSSDFATVPDAPISSFALRLPTGRFSALAAFLPPHSSESFCGQHLAMPTAITAQNGAILRQTTIISVTGCPKHKPSSSRSRQTRRPHRERRHA